MIAFLLSGLAFAQEPLPAPRETGLSGEVGTLVVDAKLPADVSMDGVRLAQFFMAGQARFSVPAGPHVVRILTNGVPTDVEIEVADGAKARVLVGRTGVTVDETAGPSEGDNQAPATVAVEFRSIDGVQLRLESAKKRFVLTAGERLTLDLEPGRHPMSVRNRDGTVIWATGTLNVGTGEKLIVQVSEGRMPELSGAGAFKASGG